MIDKGDDVRVLGHGGLLLNLKRGIWHCFREHVGGDAIDLVGYARYGADWDRRQPRMFRTAVGGAAFAGSQAPAWHTPEAPRPDRLRGAVGLEPGATAPVTPQGPATGANRTIKLGRPSYFCQIGGIPAPNRAHRTHPHVPPARPVPLCHPTREGAITSAHPHPSGRPGAPGAESIAPPAATLRRSALGPSKDGPRPRPRRSRRPAATGHTPAHDAGSEQQ